MTRPAPRILAIAGSDSSGGAGIQADIKTIAALGGYAMTAITAVTAQNTQGVQAIAPLSPDMVGEQIASCLADIGADAIKIGMLHDVGIVGAVADRFRDLDPAIPIVLDPVMVATSGAMLIAEDAIAAMKEQLFGFARVITPNLPELEHLAGRSLRNTEEVAEAAADLAVRFDCSVLAKGGHSRDDRIIDMLVDPSDTRGVSFNDLRIDTRHTHGTGCTLSSAVATLLGHRLPLEHAVRLARQFVRRAIERAPGFGAGSGPLGHHAVGRDVPSSSS